MELLIGSVDSSVHNPLTLTIASHMGTVISIVCQTGLSHHLYFLTSGHSDAQG